MAAPLLKVLLYSLLAFMCLSQSSEARSFVIDYDNNCFLKDGQPFRYISGSLHYFRVPSFYWKDRLLKMKAGGLNAVETYVPWNVHEPVPGQFNFKGNADLVGFIKLANSSGLLVIMRPGPFICAEWEFGGYPAWLLAKNTSIRLRSMDNKYYLGRVQSWMDILLPKLKSLLYSNWGPIISVQVENEYGYSSACDHSYLKFLEGIFREHLGDDVILFTNNGASEHALECGTIPSLYTTLDFGSSANPDNAYELVRKFSPRGPLVTTEYYPGWLDQWSKPHQTRSSQVVSKTFDRMLALNASVNFYMYHGGSNFGFMNGGAYDSSHGLFPVTTSYDYDAPLTEAGDVTAKFHILREIIAKYEKLPPVPIPANTTKFAYGKVKMSRKLTLFDVLPKFSAPHGPVKATFPLTMEQIGQNYGFILYQTIIPPRYAQSNVTLSINNLVRDRGIIYIGKIRQATMFRRRNDQNVTLGIGNMLQLDILVENMGRCNQGVAEPKGILGNVTLNGSILMDWQIYPINLDNLFSNQFDFLFSEIEKGDHMYDVDKSFAPSFFYGEFPVNSSHDTFLHLPGWSKGQAYVNGFNLGRYWPVIGPQMTLFVPADVFSMKQKYASVVLFELDGSPCNSPETCFVEFVNTPSLNGTVHPID
ncbi:beta-galactosidase-like [Acropora millepora]|uniref:beta-galactosidase-like n=1 Tax=Acropora millepora TaxID=45264 RepID=UPI001CF5F595|nr:beta-galactosidase-like [Acropora millepora]